MGQRIPYHQLRDIETLLANDSIPRNEILSYVRDIGAVFSEGPSKAGYHVARRLVKIRRLREKLFGEALFVRDPAWDMLLELYIARAEGRTLTVKSVCHASNAPLATAFRYLDQLWAKAVVTKSRDQSNSRQVLVSLTSAGGEAMDAALQELRGEL